jgi:hypothetical protein
MNNMYSYFFEGILIYQCSLCYIVSYAEKKGNMMFENNAAMEL